MEGARRRTRTRPAGAPSEQARGAEPHLFVALECDRPLAGAARLRLRALDEVAIGRGQSRRWERLDGAGRLSFDDGWMSAAHAVLRRVLGAWIVEDLGSKNGTLVNGSVVQRAQLADGDLIELGHTFLLFRETAPAPDAPPWTDAAELWPAAPGLATLAPALEVELAQLPAIARSPVSVLVRGETGTGKEVIASAIHGLSGRPGSFVAVNCGALSKTLVESELFGYRKGAFSGADQDRPGLVRSADRGTLFLDEIGDLPATAQAALLRALQEHEVLPVGDIRPAKVDLRVVVATHRDLEAMVARNEFRADLLARIAGFRLELPPLRERREDLGLLIAALLPRHAAERAGSMHFSCHAARALLLYRWPLNVRELEQCIAGAAALTASEVELSHLPAPIRAAAAAGPVAAPQAPQSVEPPRTARTPRPLSAEEAQRRERLVALLRAHGGNVTAVARELGKARFQVQRWLKRYGLDPKRPR
jgi:DNA-binding NtrC family response regulator